MTDFSALVTLDGTALSQEALSLVPYLKSIGLTAVSLVGVWEDPEAGPGGRDARLREVSERGSAYLGAYLQEKVEGLESLDIKVEPVVRVGIAAEEILRVAEEKRAALILIATHGRTGVERWRLGSIADKVICYAPCPALVIGPNVSVNLKGYAVRRILVPLDSSELAQAAVAAAGSWAKRTDATVELVEVVHLPTPWTADPTFNFNIADVLDWLEDGANRYLRDLDIDGVCVERTVLRTMLTGGVGGALLGHLRDKPADLVVMTSHGRHGAARWALGSVAGDLLRGPSPVLVLRPGEDGSGRLFDSSH